MKLITFFVNVIMLVLLSSSEINARLLKAKQSIEESQDELTVSDQEIIESKKESIIFNKQYIPDYIAGIVSAWIHSINTLRDNLKENLNCSLTELHKEYNQTINQLNQHYNDIISGRNIRKDEEKVVVDNQEEAFKICEEGIQFELTNLTKEENDVVLEFSNLNAQTPEEKIKRLKELIKEVQKNIKILEGDKKKVQSEIKKHKKAEDELIQYTKPIDALKEKEQILQAQLQEEERLKKESNHQELYDKISELQNRMKDIAKEIKDIENINCKKLVKKKNNQYSISIIKKAKFFFGFVKKALECAKSSNTRGTIKFARNVALDFARIGKGIASIATNITTFGLLGTAKGLLHLGFLIYYSIKAVKMYKKENFSDFAFYIGKVQGFAVRAILAVTTGLRRKL